MEKQKKKLSKGKKTAIVLSVIVVIIVGAVIGIYLNSGTWITVPDYKIGALPADIAQSQVDAELKQLGEFKDEKIADATNRHQYDIKVAVSDFNDDYSYAMMALHETVSFKNTMGQALNEICLRDYMQAWIETSRELNELSFDKDTEIGNIKNVDTGAELTSKRDEKDSSVIYVALDKEYNNDEIITVSFDFVAPVTQTGLRAGIAEIGKDKYLMDMGNFYPVLSEWKDGAWVNHPDFVGGECFLTTCSDYNVTVAAPKGWTVIATGDEKNLMDSGDYTIWTASAENVRDFAMSVTNGMDFAETTTKTGVKVRFWYYKDGFISLPYGTAEEKTACDMEYDKDYNTDKYTASALEAATTAMELYDKKIGKYGYDTMDIVVSAMGRDNYSGAGGMEYPQFVQITESICCVSEESYETLNDDFYYVIAHEIGHNWFYGVAGNDEYEDTWLDEGLTEFISNIWVDEIVTPRLEENNSESEDNENLFDKGIKGILDFEGKEYILRVGNLSKKQIDLNPEQLKKKYADTVYTRAAKFMYELRDAIGEEEFYALLQEYYKTYSFKEATTEQFIEIANKYIEGNSDAVKLFETYLSRYAH